MALERKWLAVAATPLTADGTAIGLITIADTAGFKTKQSVYLTSDTSQPTQYQVQEVLSRTSLILGPIGPKVGREQFSNVSAFLVSDNATIAAAEQEKKANPPEKDHYSAVYESDPIVADRVIQVDQYGDRIGSVKGSDGIIRVAVDDTKITLFTKPYDAFTAEYPSPTQEVYKSRIGGINGSVVETVVINYTDSTKNVLLNGFRSF